MSFPDEFSIELMSALDSLGQKANQRHVLAVSKFKQRTHSRDVGVSNPIPDMRVANTGMKSSVATAAPDDGTDILPEWIESKAGGKRRTRLEQGAYHFCYPDLVRQVRTEEGDPRRPPYPAIALRTVTGPGPGSQHILPSGTKGANRFEGHAMEGADRNRLECPQQALIPRLGRRAFASITRRTPRPACA